MIRDCWYLHYGKWLPGRLHAWSIEHYDGQTWPVGIIEDAATQRLTFIHVQSISFADSKPPEDNHAS